MVVKYQCDKCKREVISSIANSAGNRGGLQSVQFQVVHADLCGTCTDKFNKFLALAYAQIEERFRGWLVDEKEN